MIDPVVLFQEITKRGVKDGIEHLVQQTVGDAVKHVERGLAEAFPQALPASQAISEVVV